MNNVSSRFIPIKHLAFALSISSLFLIGCSRHRGVAGAYAYGNSLKNENREEVKEQEKDKSKKTIRQSH